jgi:hypothetical protein
VSEIADFLRARYAEDAQAVRANWNRDGITSQQYHDTPIDPTRLLADLEAKLALVDHMVGMLTAAEGDTEVDHYGALGAAEQTLCLLAQPFAGHPDHKGEEWAP